MLLSDPKIRKEFDRLAGVGWWQWEPDTDTLLLSDQTRKIFGFDPDEDITPQSMADLRLPEDRDYLDSLRLALKAGKEWEIDHQATTKSGKRIWIRSTGHAERREDGTVRLFGVVQDITDRMRAEIETRESRRLLEEIEAMSGIGGWAVDLTTREVRWSKQTRRIYEIEDSFEPKAKHQPLFVAPEWLPAAQEVMRQAIEAALPGDLTFEAITRRGARRWVRNTCNAEHRDGRAVRLVGTVQDVTEQKLAADRYAMLNDRLVAAINAAELRIWEFDPASNTVTWDPRTSVANAPLDTSSPSNAAAAYASIHPDDREQVGQVITDTLSTGTPAKLLFRTGSSPSELRHVEATIQRTELSGAGHRVLAVSRDVTADVVLKTELERRTREAELALATQGAFLARISHEIRTPMTAVIGMLEVLSRQNKEVTSARDLATALAAAHGLKGLLDDLIDINRLEQHKVNLDNVPFDPGELVRSVVDLFRGRASAKGLSLTATLDEGLPNCMLGDPHRIRQVLVNLIGNAAKFTETGSVRVTVEYRHDLGRTRFRVEDTGIGIAAGAAEQIFDRFFQTDASSTRRHEGSGLGLAICRDLINLMGGKIAVESQLGHGSTFWFDLSLPVGPHQGDDHDSIAAPAASRPLRILIAEDNVATQRILRVILHEAGHQVHIVPDGQAAVAALASDPYDLVIMDSMMPVMDGATATQRIRELGTEQRAVPILALTANAIAGERDRCLAAGMTDYLTKPIMTRSLLEAVARLGGMR